MEKQIRNKLLKRVFDLSWKYQLSHIGSCVTALPIIYDIYTLRRDNEPFILSSGHAALALYVVLEDRFKLDAEKLWNKHGTHPNKDLENGIYASSGSLGQGLPIAVGMALAKRKQNVYVLISDGETAEGSIWEALRIAAEQKLENLIVMVNINGFGALSTINGERLQWRLGAFIEQGAPKIAPIFTDYKDFPFLKGIGAHYIKLDEKTYKEAIALCV